MLFRQDILQSIASRCTVAEVPPFKARVRQLNDLGLTQSLEVGYRLSPRGSAVLDCLVRDR